MIYDVYYLIIQYELSNRVVNKSNWIDYLVDIVFV